VCWKLGFLGRSDLCKIGYFHVESQIIMTMHAG
jgi:hypothetical protein